MLTDNMKKTSLEYHGEWDYINPCKQKDKNIRDQQEVHGINGADFGTSELIFPSNIIINGFHFPYPLNGSNKPGEIN